MVLSQDPAPASHVWKLLVSQEALEGQMFLERIGLFTCFSVPSLGRMALWVEAMQT